MSPVYRQSVIAALITACVLVSAASYAQKSLVPDSLLNKKLDLSMMEYPSAPWTQGCDSTNIPDFPGRTFYYNVDSIFHLIATRPLNEIREEVFYLYFIVKNRMSQALATASDRS